ncbi:hypothetical protein NLJ89_g9591 [Agrocybe chaxingu]|uniref:Uncharacterized protein n=1 Tax=Agrocybe chaxingu TaxID=84603 RepID=A0A9W8K0B1_9AGAR|nr:hypothetical protein NLJ89_g9591 [Agrocybe chaxingu]
MPRTVSHTIPSLDLTRLLTPAEERERNPEAGFMNIRTESGRVLPIPAPNPLALRMNRYDRICYEFSDPQSFTNPGYDWKPPGKINNFGTRPDVPPFFIDTMKLKNRYAYRFNGAAWILTPLDVEPDYKFRHGALVIFDHCLAPDFNYQMSGKREEEGPYGYIDVVAINLFNAYHTEASMTLPPFVLEVPVENCQEFGHNPYDVPIDDTTSIAPATSTIGYFKSLLLSSSFASYSCSS